MPESDLAYYRRRQREECERADHAEKVEIRSAHRLLATIYAERVETLSTGKVERPVSLFRWESR